jgi:hypothetical protein
MNPAKSLFHAFALRLAERLTRDSPDPDQAYLAMVSTIYSQAAAVCGGEWVYVPQSNVAEIQQSRARIANALKAGEPTSAIAKREGVDVSLVRRIRRRGTIGP